jgi:hypothetical protein
MGRIERRRLRSGGAPVVRDEPVGLDDGNAVNEPG